jgi:hypothetical protein
MAIEQIGRRLRALRRGEEGMALPIAFFVMIAGMALVSAAVMASVNVQQGSHRDSSTKSAIAVADAGANIARSRIDRYAVVLASSPCLELGATGVLKGTKAASDGWCPAVTGLVGGGEYSYRVSPAGSKCGEYTLCVVATGTVGGISRRVEVAFGETPVEETKTEGTITTTESGNSPIVEGLIGEEGVEIGGSADVQVGVGSNGDVVIPSGKGSTLCGDVRHGVGRPKFDPPSGTWCAGYHETESNKTLPPVSSFMPSDIATNNSDPRLAVCTKTKPVKEPTDCELDSFTGKRKSTYPWGAEKRAISIGGNDVLTVNGGDYWVCSLELGGTSQLIMGATARVRFFFDTPEHCGLSPGATQLSLGGNNRISSSNPSVYPAFYFLGASNVNLKGNAGTDELVVYGKEATINIIGNATFKGVFAGKKVIVWGSGHVANDGTYKPPSEITPVTEKTEPKKSTSVTARFYSPQFYVECTGPATQGAVPNANC